MKNHCFIFLVCLGFNNFLWSQPNPPSCRISRIEYGDSVKVSFTYNEKGQLEKCQYDNTVNKNGPVFSYFYNTQNRISHITLCKNDQLVSVCNYTYNQGKLSKRQIAFFEQSLIRDEILHHNEKEQMDRIHCTQSNGDTISLRFEYNEAGYPIRRIRLSNDSLQNTFAEMRWDTTLRAYHPFETLFQDYPMASFFDRDRSIWTDYPTKHPLKYYINRTRDALGAFLGQEEWIFSNFKTNASGFIEEMTGTHILNGVTKTFVQKNFYTCRP
jgi:hypothetical protein